MKNVIVERGTTHGAFAENAELVQTLKYDIKHTLNWDHLEPYQKETLEMIVHKFGRILTGDHKFVDSWRDIAGYTQLVINELEKDEEASDVRNMRTKFKDGEWVDDVSSK